MPSLLYHFAAASALATLSGCVIVTPPPAGPAGATPPQPGYIETPEAPQPPIELQVGSAEGRPSGLHAGDPEAYWVWHDGNGWHLRTTTARSLHRFAGRVWGQGEVGRVRVIRQEWADRFRKTGRAMSFDFHTDGGDEEGFDFSLAEGNCAFFHLFIDGKANNNRTFVGAAGIHPPSNGFRVCHN